MKPHIKVIQRNGVDIFVTSSMTMKETNSDRDGKATLGRLSEVFRNTGMQGAYNSTLGREIGRYGMIPADIYTGSSMGRAYLNNQRMANESFANHVDSIKSPN
jgi:hypothetical protein